jgi:type I restriction enzyme S subunit
MKFRKETEFQETEIGRIARDWKVVRLKDVAEIRGSRKITQGSDTLIFIPMEAIPDDGVYAGFELRDANEVKSYVYCEPGDILLAKITPSFENGKQGIVPEEIPGKFALATTEVYPIKCKDVNKFFLFYLLKYPPLRNKLVSLMRGTTGRKRVPREALENQLIPYPPLKEQENIGKVLLTIQNLKESMRDAIDRLERLKRGLMSELLTGRIRVREENGRLSFYRETELQETEIGEIPRDWKVKKLREITTEMYYGLTAKAVEQGTGLRMLRTTDIKDYKVDWSSLPYCEITNYRNYNLRKYLLRKNDIIISRAGTAGVSVLVDRDFDDIIFGSYLIKVRLNEAFVHPKFIHNYMQSDLYWKQILPRQAGSTLKNISIPILKSIIIPLPSTNEQVKIAEILSTIDRAIESYREEITRLERLKRGLMDLLLTGKVRVVDGDVGS